MSGGRSLIGDNPASDFSGPLVVTDGTQSTTPTTGSITTSGGEGILKNLNVGGTGAIAGDLSVGGQISAGTTVSGQIVVGTEAVNTPLVVGANGYMGLGNSSAGLFQGLGALVWTNTLLNTGTISQTGNTVTCTSAVFGGTLIGGIITGLDINNSILWVNFITAVPSSTTLTVANSRSVSSGTKYIIYYGGCSQDQYGNASAQNLYVNVLDTANGGTLNIGPSAASGVTIAGFRYPLTDGLSSVVTPLSTSGAGVLSFNKKGVMVASGTLFSSNI